MSFTPETLLRHWQTLRRVPRYPQKITAGDICQHLQNENFKVGKRTVERDLQALSRIFPLLVDERAKPYGWSWDREAAAFDLPGMSMSECLTVMMAKKHLSTVMPASTLTQMAPYFRQAEQKLNALSGHSSLASWFDKVRIIPPTQPLLAPQVDETVLSVLQEGLLQNHQCVITYQRRGTDGEDEYLINPLGLVQRGVMLYLVCTIKTYSDLRILAIHRVQSAILLDTPSKQPEGFSLDAYLATGAFGWMSDLTVPFEALFTPEAGNHLYETPLSEDQAITLQEDGRLKVTATIQQNHQLVWWLLGFGDDVEVVAPLDLRARIAEKLRLAASRYG
ncbi:MAG: WYL domain-containing protein [Sulfuricella sp.]|nr:WYL domain-containing protein [Sulfuricella sp.]